MTLEVLPETEVVSFVKGHFFSGLGLEVPEGRNQGDIPDIWRPPLCHKLVLGGELGSCGKKR